MKIDAPLAAAARAMLLSALALRCSSRAARNVGDEKVCLDRLQFNADGSIAQVLPTL